MADDVFFRSLIFSPVAGPKTRPCGIAAGLALSAAVAAFALPASAQTAPSPEPSLGAAAGPADEDITRDEAEQRLDRKKQELESSRQQAQGLTADVAQLTQERAELNEKLIAAGKRVQQSEAALDETEAKLAELNGKVTAVKASITERKRTIVKMLSAMQRIGRSPPPAFVTPREDALAVIRGAMLLAKVFPELKTQADQLSAQLDGLVALEDGIKQERDAEAAETAKLAGEQQRLDALLQEKKARILASRQQLVEVNEVARQQAEDVSGLSDLIDRLDQRIAKAEVAQYDAEIAAEKALKERRRQDMLGGSGGNVVEIKPDAAKVAFASPGRLKPAMPFDQAKGKLPLPVEGKEEAKFGDPDTIGAPRQGILLQTRPRARVTAPADGWVVYAGPFRSYGQLLILNAGGGYHILLAGMNRIDVSVGQFVLAGEPVAEMGGSSSPGSGDRDGSSSQRPSLYVEFRKGGRPIDPDPWWAESSDKVQG